METIQVAMLALVQGITEFLPISSSAHLILAPLLVGYPLQGLAFDVAVHLGTLLAVIGYFRHEVVGIAGAMLGTLPHRDQKAPPQARLGWLIIVATLPVLILGLPLKAVLEVLRQDDELIAFVIAATTIGFALVLWWADIRGQRDRDEHDLGWRDALIIGIMQAMAIIPGTSRSGITITAGLLLGLTRAAASRFSFLLAIPTILMAGLIATLDLLGAPEPVDWWTLWLGATLSFVVAYLTIHFFLKFIERLSMLPFVLYRLLLGGAILVLLNL